tara:strand:- start:34 stop:900 length:867 start_codon:yes stop_codon:yes gene_type:complete
MATIHVPLAPTLFAVSFRKQRVNADAVSARVPLDPNPRRPPRSCGVHVQDVRKLTRDETVMLLVKEDAPLEQPVWEELTSALVGGKVYQNCAKLDIGLTMLLSFDDKHQPAMSMFEEHNRVVAEDTTARLFSKFKPWRGVFHQFTSYKAYSVLAVAPDELAARAGELSPSDLMCGATDAPGIVMSGTNPLLRGMKQCIVDGFGLDTHAPIIVQSVILNEFYYTPFRVTRTNQNGCMRVISFSSGAARIVVPGWGELSVVAPTMVLMDAQLFVIVMPIADTHTISFYLF